MGDETVKSLSTYIESGQTALFEKYGVFFAFSQEQFAKKIEPSIKYARIGTGMFCPVSSVDGFIEDHSALVAKGIAKDKEENGKSNIILRELKNFECFYICDVTDCVDALEDYGYTESDILKVYKANFRRFAD